MDLRIYNLNKLKISGEERIKKLRDEIIDTVPEICIERARIITDYYKNESVAIPPIIKRAKALEKILENMSIFIREGELLVGNQASKVRGAPIFPEFSVNWIEEELDDFPNRPREKFLISEKNKAELKRIIEYWKGKTHFDKVNSLILSTLPKNMLDLWDEREGKFNEVLFKGGTLYRGDGHLIADFEKILKIGLHGIISEVDEELSSLDLIDAKNINKYLFLQSSLITLGAVINFAKRFSIEAERLAKIEKSPLRKKELEEIARICRNVPGNPASSFIEALQSAWFCHLVIQIESNGSAVSFGRFDQYIYPYYKKDINKGIISPKKALELIESFWIKANELVILRSWLLTRWYSGYPCHQAINFGGQTSEERDAVNEVSYICLEATARLKLPQPTTGIIVFSGTSNDFLVKCFETLYRHGSLPSFFNNDVVIPLLLNQGVPFSEVHKWAIVGCAEPVIPAKHNTLAGGDSQFNLLKILELALNGGLNPANGSNLYPQKKDLSSFRTFKDVKEAYKNQLCFYVKLAPIFDNATIESFKNFPIPFASSVVSDHIKLGKDLMDRDGPSCYNFFNIPGMGAVNVGDSLAALKKLVFESKVLKPAELHEALKNNFEGDRGEEIRQILISGSPKYGNDNDNVDNLVTWAWDCFVEEVMKYKPDNDGIYSPNSQTISANIPQGEIVGATPDGRKAHESLADNISPSPGYDKKGLTAVLKSASKFKHELTLSGSILNVRLHPTAINTPDVQLKLAGLIKTYFINFRGFEIQFNIVSSEILKDAQKHPKKYRDLVVKVAGYNAWFISLDKGLQDHIISRTEHGV